MCAIVAAGKIPSQAALPSGQQNVIFGSLVIKVNAVWFRIEASIISCSFRSVMPKKFVLSLEGEILAIACGVQRSAKAGSALAAGHMALAGASHDMSLSAKVLYSPSSYTLRLNFRRLQQAHT